MEDSSIIKLQSNQTKVRNLNNLNKRIHTKLKYDFLTIHISK